MYIDVEDPNQLFCPEQIKVVKKAMNFYANFLLPDVQDEIYVSLNIICGKNYGGSCITHDDFEPREFFMELDGELDAEEAFRTLAHEMVHVKQFALGELKSKLVNGVPQDTWKQKNYTFASEDDLLYFAPWEVEAYGLSEGLLHKFNQYHKKR
jgi:hypothetical protein